MALVIDDKVIATLRQFAEDNPIPIEESIRIIKGEAPPPKDREGYTVSLPPCWKLVFTHSQYPRTDRSGVVWVRHMNMSLVQGFPASLPNPAAIQVLSEQLGFPSLEKCQVKFDDTVVEIIAELDK
jgi:hypothetical protein